MKCMHNKRTIYCFIMCCILVSVFIATAANAATSTFLLAGKVMSLDGSSDTPVAGATVSAWKSSAFQEEEQAASVSSGAGGAFSLDVMVDEALGASDSFNKIQIRLDGNSQYVTVCSPFLELLNFKNPVPPIGNIEDLELSILPLDSVEQQLDAISGMAGVPDVNRSLGILAGSVEHDSGNDVTGVAGVSFRIVGNNISGAKTLYMDADLSWNPGLSATTSAGSFIIYNIPLYAEGWNDFALIYNLASEAEDYMLGVYPWVRVYPYMNENKHFITYAHYRADKMTDAETEDTGTDDGGSGGGGGCFMTSASL